MLACWSPVKDMAGLWRQVWKRPHVSQRVKESPPATRERHFWNNVLLQSWVDKTMERHGTHSLSCVRVQHKEPVSAFEYTFLHIFFSD